MLQMRNVDARNIWVANLGRLSRCRWEDNIEKLFYSLRLITRQVLKKYMDMKLQPQAFLISTLDWVNGQPYSSAAVHFKNEVLVLNGQDTNWLQSW